MMKELMQKALASVAGIGDIYTDAPECAASVAAAQNLGVLARLLSADDETVGTGTLRADGADYCDVSIRADGSLYLHLDEPKDFDTSGRVWELFSNGKTFRVEMYAGETADDERWILEDAEPFYVEVLNQHKAAERGQ